MAHGINANVVHRWLREHASGVGSNAVCVTGATALRSFAAVPLPGPGTQQDIRIELLRGNATVVVSWPVVAAESCTSWLTQWLR